jgi:hypothetical protein
MRRRRTRRVDVLPPPNGLAGVLAALADALRGPLRRLGIDAAQLRLLLSLELVLAERRRKRESQESGAGSGAGAALGFVLNLMFGGLGALALGGVDDPLWGMGLAQLVLMAFLTTMLVGDYLPALVDTAEIRVIEPQPIEDRTVLAARISHVTAWLGTTLIAQSVLPLVFGTIEYGAWFAPVWIVASVLATVTSIGLSFGLFLVAMRLFDPERFRDVLLYLQVGTMVAFFAAFQLLPRALGGDALDALLGTRSWWFALAPPLHGAALLALVEGQRDALIVVLAMLAVATPAATGALALRLGGRGFVARLSAMATAARSARGAPKLRRPLRDRLAGSRTARAGYDFCLALSRRERTFRMRTYPLVGVAAALGFGFALRSGELEHPAMLCGAIYALGLYAPLFVLSARCSDDHEARWLFQVVPLAAPGEFLVGALTALVLTFVVPVALLMATLVVAIGGTAIVVDVAFAALAVVLVAILSMLALGRELPFTQRPIKNPGQGSAATMLALSLVVGAAILAHVLLRRVPAAIETGVALLPLACWWLLRRLGRVAPRAAWLTGRGSPSE